jgi:hypothetical protein
MIWFTCKKCGKKHSRGENLVGTMIFCDCGQGTTVPWSSTIPEPAVEEEAVPVPMPAPVPVPIPDKPRPSIPVPPRRRPDDLDSPGEPIRRRREYRKVNPAYCFNHAEKSSEQVCTDCGLSFCSACVLSFQDKTLCGVCKNFRIRGLNRPAHVSAMAIIAAVVALGSGPITFCLTMFPLGAAVKGQGNLALTIALSIVGLVLPIGGLLLGWMAVREMDAKPNLGGRGLALTGTFTGLVAALWSLTVVVFALVKHFQS